MSEIPEKQVKRLKSLIQEAETNLAAAKELLISISGEADNVVLSPNNSIIESPQGKIIEGVFDGQTMIGPDGKNYPVPANYASKSKLVEGDILKLTINDDGGFIYKQIEYKILLASVTYFKLRTGDQVTIIIPEDSTDTTWAAVEASF